jgi:hypothetical protein
MGFKKMPQTKKYSTIALTFFYSPFFLADNFLEKNSLCNPDQEDGQNPSH